jgi:hypothetical protein
MMREEAAKFKLFLPLFDIDTYISKTAGVTAGNSTEN